MGRIVFAAIIAAVILQVSCKKENGNFYLRVIPPTDSAISNVKVYDANGLVAPDGEYYQVSQRLELSYDINNVLLRQIKDWNDTMIYNEFTYTDLSFHEYLGEFEKDEKDKYYTLEIDYNGVADDELHYNQWGQYYYYYYDYYDTTKLTWSYIKE